MARPAYQLWTTEDPDLQTYRTTVWIRAGELIAKGAGGCRPYFLEQIISTFVIDICTTFPRLPMAHGLASSLGASRPPNEYVCRCAELVCMSQQYLLRVEPPPHLSASGFNNHPFRSVHLLVESRRGLRFEGKLVDRSEMAHSSQSMTTRVDGPDLATLGNSPHTYMSGMISVHILLRLFPDPNTRFESVRPEDVGARLSGLIQPCPFTGSHSQVTQQMWPQLCVKERHTSYMLQDAHDWQLDSTGGDGPH